MRRCKTCASRNLARVNSLIGFPLQANKISGHSGQHNTAPRVLMRAQLRGIERGHPQLAGERAKAADEANGCGTGVLSGLPIFGNRDIHFL